MELDAAAAVMAGLGGVAPPAVDEFRDFLQKIKEQVQVTDFIQVVGTDLQTPRAALVRGSAAVREQAAGRWSWTQQRL